MSTLYLDCPYCGNNMETHIHDSEHMSFTSGSEVPVENIDDVQGTEIHCYACGRNYTLMASVISKPALRVGICV